MTDKSDQNSAKSQEWQRLMQLFDRLSDLPPAEQKRFLEEECSSKEVAEQLMRMLEVVEQTHSIFDTPLTSRLVADSEWEAKKWIGMHIGDVELTGLIHPGNVAAVFKGVQKEPAARDVVVKFVHPEAPDEFRDRFRLEQAALAKLIHPNIGTMYSVGETNEGVPYMVMEYINGQMLMPHCDQNRVTLEQRIVLFLQVCDAIAFSHQRGVMHRDIKSSNIMIRSFDDRDVPLVIDFGISNHVDSEIEQMTHQSLGTPEYMSPEHFSEFSDMDVRADIYSLGMVFYTLLVGKIPFDREKFLSLDYNGRKAMITELSPVLPSKVIGEDDPEKVQTLADKRGLELKEYRKSLTQELDWIYQKATAKNKQDRYQTVGELADDIKRYRRNEVVSAKPVSNFYRVKKLVARHKLTTLVLLLVTVGVGIFTTALVYQNRAIKVEYARAEEQKKRAERERDIATKIKRLTSSIYEKPLEKGISAFIKKLNRVDGPKLADRLRINVYRIKHDLSISSEVKSEVLLNIADIYSVTSDKENQLWLEAKELANYVLEEQLNLIANADLRTELEVKANLSLAKAQRANLSQNTKEEGEFHAEKAYSISKAPGVSKNLKYEVLREYFWSLSTWGEQRSLKRQVAGELMEFIDSNFGQESMEYADSYSIHDFANFADFLNGEITEERYNALQLEVFRKSIQIYGKYLSPKHPKFIAAKLGTLSGELQNSSNPSEAVTAFEESFEFIKEINGKNSLKSLDVIEGFTNRLIVYGHYKEARKMYQERVLPLVDSINDVPEKRLRVLDQLNLWLLIQEGRYGEAQESYERLNSWLVKEDSYIDLKLLEVHFETILASTGKWQELSEHLRAGIEESLKNGKYDEQRLKSSDFAQLGFVLVKLGQYEEAIEHLTPYIEENIADNLSSGFWVNIYQAALAYAKFQIDPDENDKKIFYASRESMGAEKFKFKRIQLLRDAIDDWAKDFEQNE